ncbi:MAG TPA: hypothetical protein VHL11_08800, partial [Phototrophicaceae bacterium]|nr:hypothetical protein [Phototrophicaceae bacterium]
MERLNFISLTPCNVIVKAAPIITTNPTRMQFSEMTILHRDIPVRIAMKSRVTSAVVTVHPLVRT